MLKKISPLLVICSTLLWGGMGIVIRYVGTMEANTFQIAAIRLLISAVFLVLVLLIVDRNKLKIKLKDFPWFLLTGIVSLCLNNIAYSETTRRANLSVAVVLLYTAPFFVLIMSILIFKEKLTWIKALALLLSFVGCMFVVGVFTSGMEVKATTILIGLVAGFCYSLYTVIGKVLLKKYDSLTIVTYTFIVAAVTSSLIAGPSATFRVISNHPEKLPLAIIGSILTVALPYILYSKALTYMESSTASIIASFEVVAASLYGVVLYNEHLHITNILGIGMVVGAIILLEARFLKKN